MQGPAAAVADPLVHSVGSGEGLEEGQPLQPVQRFGKVQGKAQGKEQGQAVGAAAKAHLVQEI